MGFLWVFRKYDLFLTVQNPLFCVIGIAITGWFCTSMALGQHTATCQTVIESGLHPLLELLQTHGGFLPYQTVGIDNVEGWNEQ